MRIVSVSARLAVVAAGTALAVAAWGGGCSKKATPPAEPGCALSTSLLAFDSVTVGSSRAISFTITNSGDGTLSGSVADSCPEFRVVSGVGAFDLAGGDARTVSVRFAPTSAGAKRCVFRLGNALCARVVCTGLAVPAPVCERIPPSLAFGAVEVDSTRQMSFILRNKGGGELAGSVLLDCPEFTLVAGEGPYVLGAGQTRSVTVRFAPTSTGPKSCQVALGDSACAAVPCTASGELHPQCEMIPPRLDFGAVPVDSTKRMVFILRNAGGGVLKGTLTAVCSAFGISAGAGGYLLRAGQSRSVAVIFAPNVDGPDSCVVETGNPSCPGLTAVGVGELQPICYLAPPSLSFPPVEIDSSAVRSVKISNGGGGILKGNASLPPTCSDFTIVAGEGPFELTGSQSHTITVRFAPTVAGTKTCELDTGSLYCGAVRCEGEADPHPACEVSPLNLSFGLVEVDSSRIENVILRNSGGGTLHVDATLGTGGSCGDFAIQSGGGPYDLHRGQGVAVLLRFTPRTAGPKGCALEAGNPLCSPAQLNGAGDPHPVCFVDPGSVEFGMVEAGYSRVDSFVVRNTGGGTLRGSVSLLCAEFEIVSGDGPYALTAGQSQRVKVRLTPVSEGDKVCAVDLGSSYCAPVQLHGTAFIAPACEVIPTELDFGTVAVGMSRDSTFTIRNTGGSRLTGLVQASCSGFSVVAGGGLYSLTAGQARSVTVRFTPSVPGDQSCTVETGNGLCGTVSLSGAGVGGPPTLSVPAGPVRMGSDPGTGLEDEAPVHTPSISAFAVDRTEVTNEWYAIALNWAMAQGGLIEVVPGAGRGTVRASGGGEPCLYMDDQQDPARRCHIDYRNGTFSADPGWEHHPVVGVTWFGAAAYCNWLSGLEGWSPCYDTGNWTCDLQATGYRLPTEAEWEKAARGGCEITPPEGCGPEDGRTYPWGEGIDCTRCNYRGCVDTTVDVYDATYQGGASPYGALHMSGNAWEWCNDWYDPAYYAGSPANDPEGPPPGPGVDHRVLRGGAYTHLAHNIRCAARFQYYPATHSVVIGFRTVRRP